MASLSQPQQNLVLGHNLRNYLYNGMLTSHVNLFVLFLCTDILEPGVFSSRGQVNIFHSKESLKYDKIALEKLHSQPILKLSEFTVQH